jgi:hypothetical protein
VTVQTTTVPLPVPEEYVEEMVHNILQQRHPQWKWQLNDDAAVRSILEPGMERGVRPLPPEAIAALVEARKKVRASVVNEVSQFCSALEQAANMIQSRVPSS